MKQLGTVFKFEFMGYMKRKSYRVITIIMVAAIGVMLFWPRFSARLNLGGDGTDEAQRIALVNTGDADAGDAAYYNEAIGQAGNCRFEDFSGDALQAEAAVEAGEVDAAIILHGPLGYTRYVRNVGMYDDFGYQFDAAMLAHYRDGWLRKAGISGSEAASFMEAQVQAEVQTVEAGKDQMQTFFYTYALMFLLYMAIMIYGQFVASSVATEKSTRAMELLITSAKPVSLMFGKVFGAGCAGLAQLFVTLFAAFAFYKLNIDYYADNAIIQSVFAMPVSIMLYTLLFFVLGFFIYAFLYAALASLVSRMEDLNTTIMPVTYVFIFSFLAVMLSMASGHVDSPLVVFCSYFPLTSPMAMFVRIAMGEVAGWKVLLSVVLLVASTVGIGFLSAAIYRIGVLLYGNPPKPKEIARMLKANKAQQTPAP